MSLVEKEKGTPFDNGPKRYDGQYSRYAVLPAEERAKGFVRPVRHSYVHVGLAAPVNPLRDLTEEEKKRYAAYEYVKYEEYANREVDNIVGRFWTQTDLNKINGGCGVLTIMADALAETWATDPSYYGQTMCCGCHKHLPVQEFVWSGTNERLGS
jgi:hypothetical protein